MSKGFTKEKLEQIYETECIQNKLKYSEVKKKYNIELRPEMRFLGDKNYREVEICKLLKIK